LEIKLAKNYGFCFGVKRAIEIAENSRDATTIGPLIHNNEEINRLKENFNVITSNDIGELGSAKKAIIRTHGIVKDDFKTLQKSDIEVIDATCPFVTKPQQIVEEMSKKGYKIVIFGDVNHPEVKGVKSYGDDVFVVKNAKELDSINFKYENIATVAQTTKQKEQYLDIVNKLILKYKEVRVFNTICDATFENQAAARELSAKVDIMIVIGGKNSSNTKQLFNICEENIISYLIEDENDLDNNWFKNKENCGITAGASTPDWIIQNVVKKIENI